jgi:hypothetical protein
MLSVMELKDSLRVTRSVRLPIDEGIVPATPLLPKSNVITTSPLQVTPSQGVHTGDG